jgi:hypothetical protein
MFLQTIYHGSHFTYTTIHTHAEVTQRVMVAKLTRLTQKIVMLWHLVAEKCITYRSQSCSQFGNFWNDECTMQTIFQLQKMWEKLNLGALA